MPFNSIALHQLISSTIDMTLSQNSFLDFCNGNHEFKDAHHEHFEDNSDIEAPLSVTLKLLEVDHG